MKKPDINIASIKCLFLIVLFVFAPGKQLFSQSNWVHDQQMNFKINVPANYQKNNLMDGTDKIHAFVSPDQNLVVRVRAIPLGQQISDTQLQSIFEQNIISGAVRISDELSDLNGIQARWSGYSWVYNNVNAILANYYIVRQGMAYVVWAIVAENMVEQKTVEMSNIMGSFTLINGHPQNQMTQTQSGSGNIGQSTDWSNTSTNSNQNNWNNSGNNSQSNNWNNQSSNTTTSAGSAAGKPMVSIPYAGLKVSAINIGAEIDEKYKINNPNSQIPLSAKTIQAVFMYDGNANGKNFQVKWFSKTHNCLVVADSYLPQTNGLRLVHASIANGGNNWPEGDYLAELWFDEHKIGEREFAITNQVQAPPPTISQAPGNGTLLGKTFADGTGDNHTKSKGGKYLPVDLNNLNDDDEILIEITSGTLQFVHVHYRNSSGIWHDAYHGYNTRFKVRDLLKDKRNSYTHLVFNVNAQHERYLGTACYAEVWKIPSNTSSSTQIKQPITQKNRNWCRC